MTDASQASPPVPVLVVNAGSSSLKLRRLPGGAPLLVERIGADGNARLARDGVTLAERPIADVRAAFEAALAADREASDADGAPPSIVGHRVVHGGERFRSPTVLDDAATDELERLSPLAPLHNPANLAGIRAARELLPGAQHVAVFDTAFHADLPPRAYLYGLPVELYREHGIRRYGFHGTSHDVVTERLAERLGRPRSSLRIVSLHLGNGASAAAVAGGRSVDTTMGFTPLEGLMMGTRSGDVDPGILLHLLRTGTTPDELDDLLNRRSGLLGLSGVSNDLRDVRAAADDGDAAAAAALDAYAYRIRIKVAAMAAAMGGLDAVVFTGGVGENDARTRADACAGLGFLGVHLDEEANAQGGPRISPAGAEVEVWVVPTDEEGRIAQLARAAAEEEDRR